MQNKLLVYCDGGLANRINCLINGLMLSKIYKIPNEVYWPINRYCEVSLNDLFQTNIKTLNLGKPFFKNIQNIGIVANDNFIEAPGHLWIDPLHACEKNFLRRRFSLLAEAVPIIVVFFSYTNL